MLAGRGVGCRLGADCGREAEGPSAVGAGVNGWRAGSGAGGGGPLAAGGGASRALNSPARSALPTPGPRGSAPTCPGGGRGGGSEVSKGKACGALPRTKKPHLGYHCRFLVAQLVCSVVVGSYQDHNRMALGTRQGPKKVSASL